MIIYILYIYIYHKYILYRTIHYNIYDDSQFAALKIVIDIDIYSRFTHRKWMKMVVFHRFCLTGIVDLSIENGDLNHSDVNVYQRAYII